MQIGNYNGSIQIGFVSFLVECLQEFFQPLGLTTSLFESNKFKFHCWSCNNCLLGWSPCNRTTHKCEYITISGFCLIWIKDLISIIVSYESLFSLISFSFCAHLDGYLVFNCLLLVHFHLLSFIGPLFWILINLALIGLIFVSNYF